MSHSDLQFAELVSAAVARVGHGPDERFGPRKVFVVALWRALDGAMSLDELKSKLVQARRAGLVELARADLVAAMPVAVVQASSIQCAGMEAHFVVDSSARDPWD